MTLGNIILDCKNYNESSLVYAKKQNDKFLTNSEAIVLVLDENEMETNTLEISKQKCPGFDYFLEMFIIQEMFSDLKELTEYKPDEMKVERIIYYAENDA